MLHITGKLDNGYHNMQSVFFFIDHLCDFLMFDTERSFDEQAVDSDNSVYHAYSFLKDRYRSEIPLVNLTKNIPVSAGLGGGSSDAACFLYTVLHDVWSISINEIIDIAKDSHALGMDVPVFMHKLIYRSNLFFLDNGVGKFSEILMLPEMEPIFILIVNDGKTKLNTKSVFNRFVNEETKHMPTLDMMYIIDNLQHCQNSLQETAIKMKPCIEGILNDIDSSGAIFSRISGSGSSCFGVYDSMQSLATAEYILKGRYPIVVSNCIHHST
ncbi:MAG: hypothetical protein LBU04_04395 [Christensenellaceae bacterium]|nr:hypothetical protein [Christensenellaceae bacterium]